MAPKVKSDFIYLYFRYEPSKQTKNLEIKFSHNNAKIGDFIVTHREWALRILAHEVRKLPPGSNVRFTEWIFETNNAEIFTIGNVCFEKILIILGEEMVYWTFYMNTPHDKRIQGRANLNLSFCPCCLNERYGTVLAAIKEYLQK